MIADTMQIEETVTRASAAQWKQIATATTRSGRKLVLAYLGANAYLLDGALALYRSGERLLASAEKRGAAMEHGVRRRFGKLEGRAVDELRKLQGETKEGAHLVRDLGGQGTEDVEKRIELALMNLGLPSRERLQRLSQEIDALNQKLDEQLLRLPAEPVPDQLG